MVFKSLCCFDNDTRYYLIQVTPLKANALADTVNITELNLGLAQPWKLPAFPYLDNGTCRIQGERHLGLIFLSARHDSPKQATLIPIRMSTSSGLVYHVQTHP